MRDKYYDPDGWKLCTLRRQIELGQSLWLVCATCQKSTYFDTIAWANAHDVDLDIPLKTLGKAIRCQRCGTLGVGAYAEPYSNFQKQPRGTNPNGPVCPTCGSDNVESRRMLASEFPNFVYPKRIEGSKFALGKMMEVCGCKSCDNWWTQANGDRLSRNSR